MAWVRLLVLTLQIAVVFALVGCQAAGVAAVVDLASIPVFHRDIGDIVVSVVSGRNCSIVRLDRGDSYCVPREGPPTPPQFCARTLGQVACWANPAALPNPARPVADEPAPTQAQLADRTSWWPNL